MRPKDRNHNRIDGEWPGAPPGAGFGAGAVGVTTLRLGGPDRPLTAELWYPAAGRAGRPGRSAYATLLRDGATELTLWGRARRGAPPLAGPFPLAILSHGYPGNRMLLAHFGETLASHGFVAAALDHPGSTYADQAEFGATLRHRPRDQLAALSALMAHGDWASRLTPRAAIIGYSMGAYGAMIAGGARLAARAARLPFMPQGLGADHAGLADPRLRAVVPIGLWGGQHRLWHPATLAAWRLPCLLIGGDGDQISGWDPGIHSVFRALRGPHQHLLRFAGAGHNAAAPIPPPQEALRPSPKLDFPPAEHYADPQWPTLKMNAAAQAVVLAFLDQHLRQGPDLAQASFAGPVGFGPGFSGLSLRPAGMPPGQAAAPRREMPHPGSRRIVLG